MRANSAGKRVLNLFAYTGSFSVYAADGGAETVTTVDWSNTYIQWAQRNFALNELPESEVTGKYRFQRADVREYVFSMQPHQQYDLIVCDPPTFSNSKRTEDAWDVQRHHGDLLRKLLKHLSPDGSILFSSNFRRLKLDMEKLALAKIREITKQTLPEEYRNQRIHRSWLIEHNECDE